MGGIKMKTIAYILTLILLLSAVSALEIREGDEILIEEYLNESLYAAGESITVDAAVNGDITAFGGTVTTNKKVKADLVAMGGTVSINSEVGDDIHACGGSININSAIGGDVMSLGGTININSDVKGDLRTIGGTINVNGKVIRDVLALGGSININGPVGGSLALTGGEVTINSVVLGDVTVEAGKVKLGKKALIKGDLKYRSKEIIFKEEQVEGSIIKEEPRKQIKFPSKTVLMIFGALALLLISIIVVAIFPKLSTALADNIKKDFWKMLLYGLLALIVTPIAAIIIAITIVGIPVTIILIFLYILAIYISKIFAALYIGKRVIKSKKVVMPVIVGIIIYIILANIPFIGWLVKLLAILLGLGTITAAIFTRKKKKR